MEGRINQKLDVYIQDFKDKVIDLVRGQDIDKVAMENIIEFVYDYNKYKVGKEDLVKRKRVKNTVPLFDRCCAKRANGEQCTRKKKDEISYCGTHEKNRPHGTIEDIEENSNIKKREVWLEDINGILYYIDDNNNVYNSEHILNNITNPEVLYKYKIVNNKYSIIA